MLLQVFYFLLNSSWTIWFCVFFANNQEECGNSKSGPLHQLEHFLLWPWPPSPLCTLPIPKWDVQVFKQPPQVGKKTCGPDHHLSPPSVSLSTTTGAEEMGEWTTACLCLLWSQLIRSVWGVVVYERALLIEQAAGNAWPYAKFESNTRAHVPPRTRVTEHWSHFMICKLVVVHASNAVLWRESKITELKGNCVLNTQLLARFCQKSDILHIKHNSYI